MGEFFCHYIQNIDYHYPVVYLLLDTCEITFYMPQTATQVVFSIYDIEVKAGKVFPCTLEVRVTCHQYGLGRLRKATSGGTLVS